VNFGF
jgi:hypothetical protein